MQRLTVLVLLVASVVAVAPPALAQDKAAFPDLTPMGLPNGTQSWGVNPFLQRLEFSILTANIGGQDYVRPRDPNTGQYLLREIYEYTLWYYDDNIGDWRVVDQRRKNTICTIDDTRRGNVFPCIQEHGARYTCGGVQGVSRGWADDYYRGLTGQWVYIGDYTGYFYLQATLDPNGDLQREDIPDSGRDGDPTNNDAWVYFYWDGKTLELLDVTLGFDIGSVCPPNG